MQSKKANNQFQKNVAYNVNQLQMAWGYDAKQMADIIKCGIANYSQRKTYRAPFRLEEVALLSRHFDIDINLLIMGKIKTETKVSISVSKDEAK